MPTVEKNTVNVVTTLRVLTLILFYAVGDDVTYHKSCGRTRSRVRGRLCLLWYCRAQTKRIHCCRIQLLRGISWYPSYTHRQVTIFSNI